jgi:hypothetical protein
MGSIFDHPDFNERLFFPRPDDGDPPPGATDLTVSVPGAALHLRWHRLGATGPTLLLFHGNGEIVADYDAAAPRFAASGCDLAVVDYRGYGRSTGTPSYRRCIEDAPAVVAALTAAGAGPIVVMGRSLGSACAAAIAAAPPAGVVGLIWESGAVDLLGLIRRRGLTPPATLGAADLADFAVEPKLGRLGLPLLVLHGELDELIPAAEAERALAAATRSVRRRLVIVPGRGHNDLAAEQIYWAALAAFVAEL